MMSIEHDCQQKRRMRQTQNSILKKGLAQVAALSLLLTALTGCGVPSGNTSSHETSKSPTTVASKPSEPSTSDPTSATTAEPPAPEPGSSIDNHWPAAPSPDVAAVWQPDLSVYFGRSIDADPLAGITVIIDPGHGGTDPGATQGKITESELNFSVCKLLRQELSALGATVFMTRTDDSFVSLHRRAALAGQLILKQHEKILADAGKNVSLIPPLISAMDKIISANTDIASAAGRGIMYGYGATADLRNVFDIERQHKEVLFLSVHSNSNPDTSLKGTMVYFSTNQIIYDGERTDADPKLLRNPAYWYYRDSERQRLADGLYSTITGDVPELSFNASNPVRAGHFAVLREENLTGALIEMACMSNSSNLDFISRPENQLRLARAMAKAVYRFYCAE